MIEVEVKARIGGSKELGRIENYVRGWTPIPEVMHEDLYFSHPSRDFSRTDEALRLRRVRGPGEAWFLTYKGPKLDSVSKTREEIEMQTVPEVGAILESLGFSKVARIVKRRRGYRRGDTLLYLDDVEGLGRFVELESASHRRDSLGALMAILAELGLKSETRSYLELLLAGRS